MGDVYQKLKAVSVTIVISLIIVFIISCLMCYRGQLIETKVVDATILSSKGFFYDLQVDFYCEELDEEFSIYKSRFLNVYAAKHIGEDLQFTASKWSWFGHMYYTWKSDAITEDNIIVGVENGDSNIYEEREEVSVSPSD